MAVKHRIDDRYIGESDFITFVFNRRLVPGQSLLSATYTPESPITEDNGTHALGTVDNEDGTPGVVNGSCSARFTVPSQAVAGTEYTVKCTAICQNPTATKIEYVTFRAKAVPT